MSIENPILHPFEILAQKLQKLLDQHQALQLRVKQLQIENEHLKREMTAKKYIAKNDLLQAIVEAAAQKNPHQLREHLSRYIQDIDACILYLENQTS